MIADYGIIIEIMGFSLFLVSAKTIPELGHELINEGTDPEMKIVKLQKIYAWAWPEFSGHTGQIVRLVSIPLIVVGLILQHSEINNWFFNNFPGI